MFATGVLAINWAFAVTVSDPFNTQALFNGGNNSGGFWIVTQNSGAGHPSPWLTEGVQSSGGVGDSAYLITDSNSQAAVFNQAVNLQVGETIALGNLFQDVSLRCHWWRCRDPVGPG